MKLIILLALISVVYGTKRSCDCMDQINLLSANISSEINSSEFLLESKINKTISLETSIGANVQMIISALPALDIKLSTMIVQSSSRLASNLTIGLTQALDQLGIAIAGQLTSQFSDIENQLKSAIGNEISNYIDNVFNENMSSVYDYLRPPITAIIVLTAINLLLMITTIGLITTGLIWFKLS